MFFLWILLVVIILCVIIAYGTIEIEIKNLEFYLPKQDKRYFNKEYEIIIKFYVLNKIKIINLSITKTILERKMINNKIQNFERKLIENKDSFDFKFIDIIKRLNINLEELKLIIQLGTEDAGMTAILIGLISGILGILLRNKIRNQDKIKFYTIPVYQDRNFLKIHFNSIFRINMIHIIYIIYILKKKRRVEKNGRTSNRRSYAYSNE